MMKRNIFLAEDVKDDIEKRGVSQARNIMNLCRPFTKKNEERKIIFLAKRIPNFKGNYL